MSDNTLSALRGDLRDRLTVKGFHAFTTAPETVAAPFVWVAPDSPYIEVTTAPEDAIAFGEVLVRHRLIAVAEAGDNEMKADGLDLMVVRLLAVDLSPHTVLTVDEPGSLSLNGQEHVAVVIHLSAPTYLEET